METTHTLCMLRLEKGSHKGPWTHWTLSAASVVQHWPPDSPPFSLFPLLPSALVTFLAEQPLSLINPCCFPSHTICPAPAALDNLLDNAICRLHLGLLAIYPRSCSPIERRHWWLLIVPVLEGVLGPWIPHTTLADSFGLSTCQLLACPAIDNRISPYMACIANSVEAGQALMGPSCRCSVRLRCPKPAGSSRCCSC